MDLPNLDDVPQPWHAQPGERMLWLRRFEIFRLLGSKRTLVGAYHAWRQAEGLPPDPRPRGDAPGKWTAAALQWHWRERAEAWDQALSRQESLIYQQERAEQARRWVDRQEEQREREWCAAEALIKKANEMLKFPLVATTTRTGEHGEQVVTIQPVRWNFGHAVQMYEAAAKLARLAAAMETERLQVQVNWGELTDEQLARLAAGEDPRLVLRPDPAPVPCPGGAGAAAADGDG